MYNLIDLRGFIFKSIMYGEDPDAVIDTETGVLVNSAEYGKESFITGFLKTWVEAYPVDKIIFCLDGGNQLRKGFYPEYKEGRNSGQAKEAMVQVELASSKITEFLADAGFLLAKQDGMEADDLIAYLSMNLKGNKAVHTVDGDLKVLSALEAVTVAYYPPRASTEYYTGEVDGLPAKFVTLKKSIVGDKSDNYIGVKGLGEKAWDTLIDDYGVEGLNELYKYVSTQSWDELNADAKELQSSILTKLYDSRESWSLSFSLALLYPNLINAVQGRKLHKITWTKRVPNQRVLEDIIYELDDLDSGAKWLEEILPEFTLVTEARFNELFEEVKEILNHTDLIGWDYETYDPIKHEAFNKVYNGRGDFVDVISSKVTGVSIAIGKFCSKVYYFSENHADTDNIDHDNMHKLLSMLFDSGIEMVAHNMNFEGAVTKLNYQLDPSYWTDTKMFAYNLWEEDRAGLKHLTKVHLGYDQQTYAETLGEAEDMSQITGDEVLSYACDDSLVTTHLLYLLRVLTELEGSREFIENYDCPSVKLIVDGFIEGIPLDTKKLNLLATEDRELVKASTDRLRNILSEKCSNPNTKAAENLLSEVKAYERAKLRDKKIPADSIRDRIEQLQQKFIDGSQYSPIVSYKEKVEFKPTATAIKNILKITLGDGVEIPTIKSVSAKALTDLLVALDGVDKPARLQKFLDLLSACLGTQIKKREGEDYEKLEEAGSKILTEASAEKKHGTELNLGSPIQMLMLLYCMLGLPIRQYTKVNMGSGRDKLGFSTGGPSTQGSAIQLALAEDCSGENAWKAEVLQLLLTINKCTTREGLYWSAYPLWVHPKDGKLHPQINQSATVTHRPTGTAPNLLQVTKKDGGKTRSMFIGGETDSGEPYVYVSIDFSGQELRIIASESLDPVMLDAYIGEEKKDLHTVTACVIGKSYISITDPTFDLNRIKWDGDVIDYDFFDYIRNEEPKDKLDIVKLFKNVRGAAKTINFGVAYGAGPMTVARNLFIPIKLAEALIKDLFSKFFRLPEWKEEVWALARKTGYTRTVYGTSRHCWPDIVSKNSALKGRMERQVANYKVQGTAADILKIVMTNAVPIFETTKAVLLAPIYDEIASRVPKSKVVEYIDLMSECMAVTPPNHKVQMIPEVSVGANWGEQVELGAFPSHKSINKALKEVCG